MNTKPSILREKLKGAVSQEILAAAEAELAEKGLAATSMNAIAARAGVSVGTLYNYFKDKDVLLTTLLDDRRESFNRYLDEATASHAELPFEAQLEQVVTAIFQIFESQRNFLRIVLENEKPALVSSRGPKTSAMQFIDRLKPLTQKGINSGALAAHDADLYPYALAALMRGIMIARINYYDQPFKTAVPFVLRVFLDGAKVRPVADHDKTYE